MRHTQAIILAAVLLAGIVSGGCTRIHSAEELTKDTRPETTPVFTDAPKLEFSADGVDPYANVIAYYVEQYQKDLESDDMLQPFTYVLYDMDKDGTPELIVRTGYSEADYALYVWTADADKQPVQVEGCGNGAHTQIYGSETELGFFINSCHMDTEYIAQRGTRWKKCRSTPTRWRTKHSRLTAITISPPERAFSGWTSRASRTIAIKPARR